MAMTSPDCYASDDAFLTSLAYCFKVNCPNLPLWQLEQYWADAASGVPAVPPKWSYQTALDHVNGTPSAEYTAPDTLNSTMLVPHMAYHTWSRFMPVLDHNSAKMYIYSCV